MKKKIYLSILKPSNGSLESFTTATRNKNLLTLSKASVLGLLLLIAAAPSFAQNQNEKTKKEAVASKLDLTPQTIKGVVLSMEDSTALDGANIILQGTGVGTITDKQGRFVFPQQLKEGDVLLFSFVGQQTQEYKVPALVGAPIVIKMKMGYDLTGELSTNEVYTRLSRRNK